MGWGKKTFGCSESSDIIAAESVTAILFNSNGASSEMFFPKFGKLMQQQPVLTISDVAAVNQLFIA